MSPFADLRGLFNWYERDGEEALAAAARADVFAALEGLKQGLVENFTPREVGTVPFVFLFRVVIFPAGGGELLFYLTHDGSGTVTATSGLPPQDGEANPWTTALRAPIGKMIYIIAGSGARDSWVYRSRILTWWSGGEIQADGDLMLLQQMQGSFGG